MNLLEQIVSHFGTKTALAKALDVKPQNVTRWTKYGFPPNVAIKIEIITEGKFKAIEIPLYSSVA